MTKRKIAILGSTGSIGSQALDVVTQHPSLFEVVALVAYQSKELLFEQVRTFKPTFAGLVKPIDKSEIPSDLNFCQWVFGCEALTLATQTDCDDVLVSVVGMVGLDSVLSALSNHKRVLLANKEALVAGGQLVIKAAKQAGEHSLIPVDSEHSAIFQCLQGASNNSIKRILLTCSGGPFRTFSKEDIRNATRSMALKHPNWVMGQKITIDSASLFNKALEMIEAKWLFDLDVSQIEVCIHPQSVIHSGVYFDDGALIAQLGTPDMRLPILYAMAYPARLPIAGDELDLFSLSTLSFERPDEQRFPSLRMAREAMESGNAAGCVLNAANEIAVSHLLQISNEKIMTLGMIYDIVDKTLQKYGHLPASSLEEIRFADSTARAYASSLLPLN